jgi:hypothetical protein
MHLREGAEAVNHVFDFIGFLLAIHRGSGILPPQLTMAT